MNRGELFLVGLGIVSIYLGSRGFTRQGLPWGRKNLTGPWAKVVGGLWIFLGLGIIAFVIADVFIKWPASDPESSIENPVSSIFLTFSPPYGINTSTYTYGGVGGGS